MQLFLEVFAFGFFIFAIGKLDPITQAANGMVMAVENVTFFPMMGVSQAVSIIVGKAIGREKPEDGQRAAISGVVLSSSYLFILLTFFLFFPRYILYIFIPHNLDHNVEASIYQLGALMLRFFVLYSFFDGIYLTCFGALRGAGDVYYLMSIMAFWSLVGVVIPITFFFYLNLANVYTIWYTLVGYVIALTINTIWRFKSKKWMTKRVIERFDPLH
jgi:MATE family multidrug resistance protein